MFIKILRTDTKKKKKVYFPAISRKEKLVLWSVWKWVHWPTLFHGLLSSDPALVWADPIVRESRMKILCSHDPRKRSHRRRTDDPWNSMLSAHVGGLAGGQPHNSQARCSLEKSPGTHRAAGKNSLLYVLLRFLFPPPPFISHYFITQLLKGRTFSCIIAGQGEPESDTAAA